MDGGGQASVAPASDLVIVNRNVGIGTATPGFKLDVQGGQINGVGTNNPTSMLDLRGTLQFFGQTTSPVMARTAFRTDDSGWQYRIAKKNFTSGAITDLVTAADSGYVGIGTTSPAARNLPAPTWTDPTIVPRQTLIKAVHINEIRAALADVYTAGGQSAPTYTETPQAGTTIVRALQFMEMRTAVVGAPVCTVSVTPQSVRIDDGGGVEGVIVVAPCGWTATSQSFVRVEQGVVGTGSGTVIFRIDPNPYADPRVGVVDVSGTLVSVEQGGSPGGPPYNPPTLDPANDEISYVHLDAIGSVRAVTNAGGSEVARYEYLPFGTEWQVTGSA